MKTFLGLAFEKYDTDPSEFYGSIACLIASFLCIGIALVGYGIVG